MKNQPDAAVLLGRMFGLIVIVIAVALGAKLASEASGNEVWVFLATVVTPVGIGFLIVMAAEAINQLRPR